jgi:hypothetical protein
MTDDRDDLAAFLKTVGLRPRHLNRLLERHTGQSVHKVYLSRLIHGTKGDVAARLVRVIAVLWAELPAETRKRLLAEE